MQFIVPTIICILILVALGTTLSAGFLQSAEYLSAAIETGNDSERDMLRTTISSINSTYTAEHLFLIDVLNNGQTKIGDFPNWDVIAEYYDDEGSFHSSWLPYTADTPGINEWYISGIYYGELPEVYDPGLLNRGEYLSLALQVEPAPAAESRVRLYISTPTGSTAIAECDTPAY